MFRHSLLHWYVPVHTLAISFTESNDKKVPYLVLCVSMVWKSSCNSSPLRTPSAKYALNSSKDNFPSSEMVGTDRREANHFNFVYCFIFYFLKTLPKCLYRFICVCIHIYLKRKNNSRC